MKTASDAKLAGLTDPEVLKVTTDSGRVLVSQDRGTMPRHFARYIREAHSPGVIILRDAVSVATAIEELLLIWNATEAEEWVNRLVWVPL